MSAQALVPLAGGAVGAIGAREAGKVTAAEAIASGRVQDAIAAANATISLQDAALREERAERTVRRELASSVAATGGMNVTLEGSLMDVWADEAREAAQVIMLIQRSGIAEAAGYYLRGVGARAAGNNRANAAIAGGKIRAGTSLLTGGIESIGKAEELGDI